MISLNQKGRYIIASDLVLDNNKILPSGVSLVFAGGIITFGIFNLVGCDTKIESAPGYIFNLNSSGKLTGTWDVTFIYSEWFGAKGDGITGDSTAIKNAIDSFNRVYFLNKTYVFDSPVVIENPIVIDGEGGSILKNTTTFFSENNGEYTIGQGNVFQAIGIDGLTLKNVTIKGSYNETWGKQNTYDNHVPVGQGSKLLFFYQCSNVVLDNFKIVNSFSSNVNLTTDYEGELAEVYGFTTVLISECENVELNNCKYYKSCGESWHIYNCKNVTIKGCNFVVDYCTSFIDVTYSDGVVITGNNLVRNLQQN